MKRVLMSVLLCGMAAAATGAPLEARVKFDGTREMIGTLEGRKGGSVVFRPQGNAPVNLAESRIAEIDFRMDGLKEFSTAVAKKEYEEALEIAERVLEPAMEYDGLPGNLSLYLLQWMTASYWGADYEKTVELAELFGSVGNATLSARAKYYGLLAGLETGGYGEMKVFLGSSAVDKLFPEESAPRLYIAARMLQEEGEPLAALRAVSKVIALHSRDTDWAAHADLLCAELYYELDMPESAQAVLEDIGTFYKNKTIQKKAAAIAANQE